MAEPVLLFVAIIVAGCIIGGATYAGLAKVASSIQNSSK